MNYFLIYNHYLRAERSSVHYSLWSLRVVTADQIKSDQVKNNLQGRILQCFVIQKL